METLVINFNLAMNAVQRSILTACRSVQLYACPAAILFLASAPMLYAHAQTVGVVVSGLGGEERYTTSFSATADAYVAALQSLDSMPDTVVQLDESATRETIVESIRQQASLLEESGDGVFILMLIGHGNAGNSSWRFNVAGPDLTTEDLIAALNEVTASRQLVVLATSASGAALAAMKQPGRVVVTATKSGGEINTVRFPEYLAEAMSSTVADYDRNEILTIAEAYRFAELETLLISIAILQQSIDTATGWSESDADS